MVSFRLHGQMTLFFFSSSALTVFLLKKYLGFSLFYCRNSSKLELCFHWCCCRALPRLGTGD